MKAWVTNALGDVSSENLQTITLYVLTLFGSILMYAFSLSKGFNGTIEFLKKTIPNKPEVFYHRVDFIIISLTGSIIGTIFFSPNTHFAALSAGFGWIGALNILTTKPITKP